MMDATLFEKKYMDLTYEEADNYCKKLINSIKQVNGEFTQLWHNTSFYQMSSLALHELSLPGLSQHSSFLRGLALHGLYHNTLKYLTE
jgi:hypothetical protein